MHNAKATQTRFKGSYLAVVYCCCEFRSVPEAINSSYWLPFRFLTPTELSTVNIHKILKFQISSGQRFNKNRNILKGYMHCESVS